MFWRKLQIALLFSSSVINCSCHLPLVLPLALALFVGTPAAVWITYNVGFVYGGMTLFFIVSIALGVGWTSRRNAPLGLSQKIRQISVIQTVIQGKEISDG